MKLSIVLTVFDRPELMLLNTFMGLAKQDLRDAEVIVVDDASTLDYASVVASARAALPLVWISTDTVRDRPETYFIQTNGNARDGCYNNPAYAMNVGLREAKGDAIALMSSDVILPPGTIDAVMKRDLDRTVVTPKVIDMDSAMVYCGEERIFPVPWFLVAGRSVWEKSGFQDEEYLKGIAFEDNDMAARLALATGRVAIDQDIVAFHQSHPQTAYSDGLRGWKTNRDYTFSKWGGVPFDRAANDPLAYDATMAANTVLLSVGRK